MKKLSKMSAAEVRELRSKKQQLKPLHLKSCRESLHSFICGRWRRRCSWLAILLSGIVAYRLLPISALPQVDYPPSRW
jgi:uncharacterized membrane protein YkvA (DUF1232 family)